MVEHDKIITHLSKQEKRRLTQLTTEIVRSWMIKDAEVDMNDVRELRALQLKRDGWKQEKIDVALAKEFTEPITGA